MTALNPAIISPFVIYAICDEANRLRESNADLLAALHEAEGALLALIHGARLSTIKPALVAVRAAIAKAVQP